MAGIVGYGAYIPRNRIKVEEIAKVWGADAPSYKKGLDARGEVRPCARPGHDHDVRRGGSKRPSSGPGSTPARSAPSTSARNRTPTRSSRAARSWPRPSARRPTSTRADLEFACKAGTEGMFVASRPGQGRRDQVRPGHRRRHLAGRARRRPRVLGRGRRRGLHLRARTARWPRSLETYSYTTDTPDFWRREYQYYPRHGGRFTGEPAYFKHVTGCGPGHHGEGRHEAGGLRVRRLPPAERQVPAARRRDAGLHQGADRARAGSSPRSATPTPAPRRSA